MWRGTAYSYPRCCVLRLVADSVLSPSHVLLLSDHTPLLRKAVIETLATLGRDRQHPSPLLKPRALLPFLCTPSVPCFCFALWLSPFCVTANLTFCVFSGWLVVCTHGRTDSFLRDHDRGVRDAAGEQLSKAGAHGELLLIEGVLKDSNPLIRASASLGLAHLGAVAFRPLLLTLADRDANVRAAAAAAIESVGQSAILSHLSACAVSQRRAVVLTAREILVSPYPFSEPLRTLIGAVVASLGIGTE